MYNQYIKPVFREIMGSDFAYDNADDVSVMHSITFLCQINGAPIGHYVFRQTECGPKSSDLADDLAYMCDKDKAGYQVYSFEFSKQTKAVIQSIKSIVAAYNDFGLNCSKTTWIACAATLVYWKEFVYPRDERQVLLQTMRRAGMYVEIIRNQKAYVVLDRLLSETV